MSRKPILGLTGFLAAWLGGTACFLCLQPADSLLDHDEIYWIGSAYYYELAWVQHDWRNPAWQLLPARENPPVAKYVIGMGLAAAGHHVTSIDNLSYFYLYWLGWEHDPTATATGIDAEKRGRVVAAATPGFRQRVLAGTRAPLTRPMVRAARNTIAVCGVLASLLLFLLGAETGHRGVGLLASQLLLFHPAVASAFGHALADPIALLFSIGAALAVFGWSRRFAGPARPRFSQGLPATLFTGLLLGLACGAKMNSLVVVGLAGVAVALAAGEKWVRGERREAGQVAAHGLLILLVGFTVFVLVNPAILQDLPGGLAATVAEHHQTEKLQGDAGGLQISSLAQKLGAVVALGFHDWILFAAMLAVVAWAALRRWHDVSARFAVCWWLVAMLGVTAWIPFAWPRYVIPLLPPSAWLAGIFLAATMRSLVHRLTSAAATTTKAAGASPPG
jgi:hypothetical protein